MTNEEKKDLRLFVAWLDRNVTEREELVCVDGIKTLQEFLTEDVVQKLMGISFDPESAPRMFWGNKDMTIWLMKSLNIFFNDYNTIRIECSPNTTWLQKDLQTSGVELLHNLLNPTDINVPERWERCFAAPYRDIFEVKHFFSMCECRALIAACKNIGFESVNYDEQYRSNDRIMIQSEFMRKALYVRVQKLANLPCVIADPQDPNYEWKLCGVNPQIRFCRYKPQQHFSAHVDGCFIESLNVKSFYTLNVYLNARFKGGSTRFFLDPTNALNITHKVIPSTGTALLFDHQTKSYSHDGAVVLKGVKYLFRTDIMYQKQACSLK